MLSQCDLPARLLSGGRRSIIHSWLALGLRRADASVGPAAILVAIGNVAAKHVDLVILRLGQLRQCNGVHRVAPTAAKTARATALAVPPLRIPFLWCREVVVTLHQPLCWSAKNLYCLHVLRHLFWSYPYVFEP